MEVRLREGDELLDRGVAPAVAAEDGLDRLAVGSPRVADGGGAPPAGDGDCGVLAEADQCAGDVVEWCDEMGMPASYDCAQLGATCQCDETGFCDCG